MPEPLELTVLALAALPATLHAWNWALYRIPDGTRPGERGAPAGVSILVPARDEEDAIGECVRHALASAGVDHEVLVLDDGSEDETAGVAARAADGDPRFRLLRGDDPPPGWSGKPYACQQLGMAASRPLLLFVDADVRLAPDAAARLARDAERRDLDLLSGVPRQITHTLAEKLVVPLIHTVLLGYLPLALLPRSRRRSLAAACGQLIAVRAAAWRRAGGHGAIRNRRHDGVALARLIRQAGGATGLADATPLAECRMYHDVRSVISGFAKNATEGMATWRGIVPWTVLLVGGHVLPLALAGARFAVGGWPVVPLVALALVLGTRLANAVRYRQSFVGAALHPVGVALLVSIQWYAVARRLLGWPVAWKGRPS